MIAKRVRLRNIAYLREEKDNLEVSYPIKELWEAIPKALGKLEWKVQETDEEKHHLNVKTKGAFLSYPSTMKIDLSAIDEKTTKMSICCGDACDYDYSYG